ncbi:hypothetical protein VTL71DRAFT_11475 [Oculimacula yallundae]|uniref:Uncharacterized protein n=1 Tax=Oculimacula yallundae TaxID=86028 RepID=A0ABR4CQQ4_9HELO
MARQTSIPSTPHLAPFYYPGIFTQSSFDWMVKFSKINRSSGAYACHIQYLAEVCMPGSAGRKGLAWNALSFGGVGCARTVWLEFYTARPEFLTYTCHVWDGLRARKESEGLQLDKLPLSMKRRDSDKAANGWDGPAYPICSSPLLSQRQLGENPRRAGMGQHIASHDRLLPLT